MIQKTFLVLNYWLRLLKLQKTNSIIKVILILSLLAFFSWDSFPGSSAEVQGIHFFQTFCRIHSWWHLHWCSVLRLCLYSYLWDRVTIFIVWLSRWLFLFIPPLIAMFCLSVLASMFGWRVDDFLMFFGCRCTSNIKFYVWPNCKILRF